MNKEELKAYRQIVCYIPLDFDYELNLHLAELKNLGVDTKRKTKAQLIIEFARQGYNLNKIEK
jgi:hypothetical protein